MWFFGSNRRGFSYNYANEFLGLHDLTEIFTAFGDVPTHHKNVMNLDQRKQLEEAELDEIEVITNSCQSSSDYDLERTLLDTLFKETIEAQVGSYLDKFDGYMSCVHELLMGNYHFEDPHRRYCTELGKFRKGKFPRLFPLFESGHPVFDINGLISGTKSCKSAYNLWIEADKNAQWIIRHSSFVIDL